MQIQNEIKNRIEASLEKLGLEVISPDLEYPADMAHGDYSTNVAMQLASKVDMNPRELAEKIVAEINYVEKPAWLEGIEVAGPGFINITLTADYFAQVIATVDGEFGSNKKLLGQKIMVEYTDPNPFKVFHIGHLMTNTIGESLARLYEISGAEVVRANYQGDVGPHVAKAIWGMQQLVAEMPDENSPISDRTSYLGKCYAYGSAELGSKPELQEEINRINRAVYEGSDPNIQDLYKQGRAWSLEHFEQLYSLLGTKFEHYFFESQVWQRGISEVKKHTPAVFKDSEGAIVFPGENYGLHTRVFVTSLGLPLYEAKDIGLNLVKFETEPDLDLSIIVTANEQDSYFRVITKALELIDVNVGQKTKHISHGMMKFPEGKMGSRTGNVITGESLIADMQTAALDKLKERFNGDSPARLADRIAVAAIKFTVLKQSLGKDIIFERDQSLAFEGDTGPYLQYTHARCHSILDKYGEADSTAMPKDWETTNCEKLLERFPVIVSQAVEDKSPHTVAVYLIELARAFNSWYGNTKILQDGDPATAYRVVITRAVAQTIKNGLEVLGIEAPNEM